MRSSGSQGLTLLELLVAMFLVALAIGTVANVFAGSAANIGRSKTLTQGAFLAQTVMEAALLIEPFQPVAEPIEAGPDYPGFTYVVQQVPWDTDTTFFEIQVKVYHDSISSSRPLATCATLRKYGGGEESHQIGSGLVLLESP